MKAGRIEVTGVPLDALIRAAYNPSQPRGLGMLHFQPGDLTDDEVSHLIERHKTDRIKVVGMDYVKGRAVKFDVLRGDGERLFIKNKWFDHSDGQLRELLVAVGLSGDLVAAARQEEADYIEASITKATAFLKEKGGEFIESPRDELPEDINIGLIYGSEPDYPGKIKREWLDHGNIRYSI